MSDIVERLRKPDLQKTCPFAKGMPDPKISVNDPCPVCGDTGDIDAETDNCVQGRRNAVGLEAADAITALREENARLRRALLRIDDYETDWNKGTAANVDNIIVIVRAALAAKGE